eukprot:320621_1
MDTKNSKSAKILLKWALVRREQMMPHLEKNQWIYGPLSVLSGAMAVASHLGDEQVSDPQTLGISNAAANGGKGTLFADCLGIIASDLEGEELVKYIKLRPHYLPSGKSSNQHRRTKKKRKRRTTQKHYLTDLQNADVMVSNKDKDDATYLNPLYHPSAAEYMTTIKSSKLTHVPLMNVHIVGKVDSHTDQISEGSFNLWKNYDMPQRQRLDVAWTKLSDRSDAKIGRFMVELQTSLRLELQRKAKENLDHVSKLNRDKEELNMYKLFEDCLRYAWGDYNRKYIVKQFESWNRKEDGDIKWIISFNVGSCTKLMNKKRLNKSIVWRSAVTAFLTYTKNSNYPLDTTNNNNNNNATP